MARAKREAPRQDQSPRTPRHQRGTSHDHSHSPGQRPTRHKHNKSQAETVLSTSTNSHALSADSLAKLNAANNAAVSTEKETPKTRRKREQAAQGAEKRRRKKRVVSGGMLEEGDQEKRRSAARRERSQRNRRCLWVLIILIILLMVILIPVGVVVVGKQNKGDSDSDQQNPGPAKASGAPPSNNNLGSISRDDIPTNAKGTILDPFSWYDTTDFNVTYTDAKVGGLPIMGLNSSWDDSKRANENVPPLNQPWKYGPATPIRGMNVGGWLSIEPFITPSMFDSYNSRLGIVDEYTLCKHLGPSKARDTLEKHYSTFVTEQTMADIAAAGMDHIRIPFSYWAVTTYPGDPYVSQVSWRYLLRGIEWARKYGLRVNLDLHAVPGSQNGWNHSGRQGVVGWLNGTDGDLNGQRSLDLHSQIAEFFAQPRYKNILSIYGLVNEPRMVKLQVDKINTWTAKAVGIVREKGIKSKIAFGDGFLGLPNWKGQFSNLPDLILDAHQYVIFNQDQIAFGHKEKAEFACSGWAAQTQQSINTQTGFGPTICGEWSQADTDCAEYVNNVGAGTRWEGTLDLGDPSANVLTPSCPKNSGKCECTDANADPSAYSSEYKQYLQMFAEAQMTSFELGWGWFYWTWDTERSVQWSWKKGLAAGILPKPAYKRDYNCTKSGVPDYKGLPENY